MWKTDAVLFPEQTVQSWSGGLVHIPPKTIVVLAVVLGYMEEAT